MSDRPTISKEAMREGFAKGRRLCQEEWSSTGEIKAVDDLAAEGACIVTDWQYSDNFQCSRRYAQGIMRHP